MPPSRGLSGTFRNEVVATDVFGYVVADNPQAWVGTTIDTDNGTYHLDVSAGLWVA